MTAPVPARPRVTVGEWVSAAGGVLLLVSLFAPWEHRPTAEATAVENFTGFGSFGLLTAVLAAVGVVPVVHAVRRWIGHTGVRALLLVSCGAIALTVILFGTATSLDVASEPGGGLYAGLVGAGAIAVGGALRLFLLRAPSP